MYNTPILLLSRAYSKAGLTTIIGFDTISQINMPIERRPESGLPKNIERAEMRIPLTELAHNVPVDREHVQTLARSIEQSGQLSPILVWIQDSQIIDGFHRIEALRVVKTDIALCNLIECSEEEFRDARITSAVTHKGISFARVATWTRDVFRNTPWASQIKASQAFHLDQSARYPRGKDYRRALRSGLKYEELQELLSWVKHKSSIWGLKPEQIANMLDLADITSPLLIPLVGPRHQVRESVLTKPMLRSIVSQIPAHQDQEALARKAIAEKLNEAEVRRLVIALVHAQSPEQKRAILSTSWVETSKPAPTPIITEEEIRRSRERYQIEMLRVMILDIARTLPGLPIDNYPDLKALLDQAIHQLLISITQYQGEHVDIIKKLQDQIDQLTKENQSLRSENTRLDRNLTALRNAMGLARKITDEEARLRKD